ncbi:MAG: AAA family ATPase [Candidatus Sulfotelmatobacter sp.]
MKIVKLPDLPEHGDVSDYLDSHSVEDLIREIDATPPWRPEDAEEVDHFTSLVEIMSQGAQQADWVIGPGYVERSAITSLSSKIKFGKSSLLLSAIRAVLEGRDFLGHSTVRGPVVMVSEMAGAALRSGLQRAGLQSQDGLWIMEPRKLFGLSWPQVVDKAAKKCKKTGAVLLAIDTLGWAAHLTGTQENDAGTMMEVYRPLQQIAGSGFGIWTVSHERKAGGDLVDSTRGSSAAGGSADILMSLGKPAGNHRSETVRKISAIGRFSETPSELVIDWTPASEYAVLGNSDAVTRDRATQAILDALPFFADTAKTRIVLQEETGESMTTIRRVLKELKAVRTGAGTKDDPFKYRRREIGGGKE